MAKTTNAMRLLKAAGIPFDTLTYTVDEQDLSGVTVAAKVGLPEEMVFKTLLLRGERTGVLVCVLQVAAEIDLKALAQACGDKKVEMTAQRELLPLTGYVRGGVSPVGMKKKYPTYLDQSALDLPRIAVSGGARGCQVLLSPKDLMAYAQAIPCDVSLPPSPDTEGSS